MIPSMPTAARTSKLGLRTTISSAQVYGLSCSSVIMCCLLLPRRGSDDQRSDDRRQRLSNAVTWKPTVVHVVHEDVRLIPLTTHEPDLEARGPVTVRIRANGD